MIRFDQVHKRYPNGRDAFAMIKTLALAQKA